MSTKPTSIEIVSRPIGGGRLAQAALAGELAQWYDALPRGDAAWRAAAEHVIGDRDDAWKSRLAPAFDARGRAGARLESADVVVTTGQQPGLFGGPLYTLYKALTARAIADVLAQRTGLRVAPVFWAATDDSDYAEANHVSVIAHGELRRLDAGPPSAAEGTSMSRVPLGDVDAAIETLASACGSAPNADALRAARDAYAPGHTVGGAYVALLRDLLESVGIAVLDAAHPAVRQAAAPTLRRALERAHGVSDAIAARSSDIERAGFESQVAHVPDLALVFRSDASGLRRRITIAEAAAAASDARDDELSPNVLLRPVVERQILPTVAYIAGPGEIAYFAQVSAVADALGLARPRAVPRWGGVVIDPPVREALDRQQLTIDDLRDPHAAERLVARRGLAPDVRDALTRLRESLRSEAEVLDALVAHDESLRRSVGSMRATAEFRVERLERRLAAARKRSGSPDLRDVRLAQASVYPDGAPQERVLSFIPFMARYGDEFTKGIQAATALHADELIRGG